MNEQKTPLHSSEVLEDIGQDLILTNIREKLLFSIKLLPLGQDTTSLKSVFKFTENEICPSENQTGPSFTKFNSYENLVRDKVRTGKHLDCEQVISSRKILGQRRQVILTG